MKKSLEKLKLYLEGIDGLRDRILFIFIKPFWPRWITPNHITTIRILIALFLIFSLFYLGNDGKAMVISLFIIGAFTDMLDGSVARGLKKETKLGAVIDPVADRILIIPIAIYSLFEAHKWLFISIILFKLTNALVSVYAEKKGIFMQSNIFGKIKMVLQSIVFAGILVFWPKEPNIFFIYLLWISVAILLVSIFFKIIEFNSLYGGKFKNI